MGLGNVLQGDMLQDGFMKCGRPDCDLEVVRPGKAQCWCDDGTTEPPQQLEEPSMATDEYEGHLDAIIEDLDLPHLQKAARTAWVEVHRHPTDASCACVALAVLVELYAQGYVLAKKQVVPA